MIESLIVFALALMLLAYIPGRLLLRIARVAVAPLDMLTLSVSLGIVLSATIYWILAYFSIPQFLNFLVFGAAGFFTYSWLQEREWPRLRIKGSHWLLIGTILLGIFILATSPIYYSNMTVTQDGRMSVCPVFDAPLHTAIANELTHSIPPRNPVFSGWPLSYHIGADLPAAIFSNLAGLSVTDLTVRFIPTVYLILTMLSVFCFSRSLLVSDYGAAVVTFLVLFGEDFSFIPGLLHRSSSDWSVQYFGAPTTFSLFFVNPMLPALGLLFLGLYCLLQSSREGQFKWQILAGLLFAALAACKIFTAVHLGMSMTLAGAIYFVAFRNRQMLQSCLITATCMAPVLIGTFLLNRGGARIAVNLFQSHTVRDMLQALGLTAVSSLPQPLSSVVAASIYLIGSFGVRAIGIPAAMKEILHPRVENPVNHLLALFVLVGVILNLAVSIVPAGFSSGYDNAVWFYLESKYVAWIFVVGTVLFVYRIRTLSFLQGAIITMILVAASLPATIQHFVNFNSAIKSRLLSRDAAQVLKYLRFASRPGEVVLAPEELIGPLALMTKCHLPVGPYSIFMVPIESFLRRTGDLQTFWAAWQNGQTRDDILRTENVNYLITNKQDSRPEATTGLIMTFENAEWIVYRTADVPRPKGSGN